MDAGLLDVLHYAADNDLTAVSDSVDVQLDGVFQVAVEQEGAADARGAGAERLLAAARIDNDSGLVL